jgi:hypothetical protein
MASVTFPIPLGGDGSTVTDDSNASTGLANGGHRTRFVPALSQVVNIANTFVANASIAAANTASAFRNKLINGDFQVWQRGTTFTDPTGPATMYTADRWAAFRGAWTAGITVTKQNVQANSSSIRVQRNSGNTSTAAMQLTQSFETIDVKKLAGKTVTLQVKALKGANFSAVSSALTVQILYGTGTDGNLGSGFTGSTAAGTLAATLTTTNALFTLTAAIPANATQLAVRMSYTPDGTMGAAGAADYFEVTDVQLEEGSVATSFERRPYGLELGLCQRYYEKSYNDSVSVPTNTSNAGYAFATLQSGTIASSAVFGAVRFKESKRSSPTIKVYSYTSSTVNAVSNAAGTDLAASSGVPASIGTNGFTVLNNSGAAITPSLGGFIFHWSADSEL